MPGFVHIDIAADDPERAVAFYEKVFGWTSRKLEGPMPYWLIATTPSAAGGQAVGAGVARREAPWQSVTPTIDVASADDTAARITAAGGTIVQPKMLIPEVGYLVTFKDTEGNVFAVLEAIEGSPFAQG